MKRKKRIWIIIPAVLMAVSVIGICLNIGKSQERSQERSPEDRVIQKTYAENDALTYEEFETILNVLRDFRDNELHDTGIHPKDEEQGRKMTACFRRLFLGEDAYAVVYNYTGYRDLEITDSERTPEGGTGYTWDISGKGSGKRREKYKNIYIGWLKEADPEYCISAHDTAWKRLEEIAEDAPPGDEYKYFFDRICEMFDYDTDYTPEGRTVYGGIKNGKCVCSGYSHAFYTLCFMKDLYCIDVTAILKGEMHSRNVVRHDGKLCWIDATLGDGEDGINYGNKNFLFPLEEKWIKYFSEPYLKIKKK